MYNDTCAAFEHCASCGDKVFASERVRQMSSESFLAYASVVFKTKREVTDTSVMQHVLSMGCPAMVTMFAQNFSIGCFDDASAVLPGVKTISELCCKTCQGSGDNSCKTALNGECDVPSGNCAAGTDATDCAQCVYEDESACSSMGCRWVASSSSCSGDAVSPKVPEPGPAFTPVPGTLDRDGQVITATNCVGVVECYNRQRYCKGQVDCGDPEVAEECPRTCGRCGDAPSNSSSSSTAAYSGYSSMGYSGYSGMNPYYGNHHGNTYSGMSTYAGHGNTYSGMGYSFFRL
jgi:hypothetical protein